MSVFLLKLILTKFLFDFSTGEAPQYTNLIGISLYLVALFLITKENSLIYLI